MVRIPPSIPGASAQTTLVHAPHVDPSARDLPVIRSKHKVAQSHQARASDLLRFELPPEQPATMFAHRNDSPELPLPMRTATNNRAAHSYWQSANRHLRLVEMSAPPVQELVARHQSPIAGLRIHREIAPHVWPGECSRPPLPDQSR